MTLRFVPVMYHDPERANRGQYVRVAILGVLAGLWFVAMGAYGMTHAERSPESPAGHWMSHPGGRRIGGALTMIVGAAVVVGSLTLL